MLSTLNPQLSTCFAATKTWDGGGANVNWATATNWVGDVAPVAGDDLVFPTGAAQLSNSNNFPASTVFNSISLSGANYFLSGSTIGLNAGIDAANATGPNNLYVPLTLNSNQTITTGPATLGLYGAIDTNGKDLTFAGNGSASVFSIISGTGGVIKTGFGVASLNVSNTFSGAVQILQSGMSISDGNALGATSGSTTVSNDAQLYLGGSSFTVPEPLVLSGLLGSAGAGAKTWSGPITLAVTNATVDVISNAPLTINGVVSGGGFTKTGSDVLTLNAGNIYTGATTVAAGTLRVNGSQSNSPIQLAAGTLGGTGTVGAVTASSSAAKTIAPGTGGPGILTCSNLALSASTTFAVELNGTTPGSGHDQLRVRGTVALNNALLNASLGFVASVGQTFVIIDNDDTDPVIGTFAGLPEATTFALGTNQFWITYAGGTGNDVVLLRTNLTATGVMRVWTGAGADNFWINANNWTNNLAGGPGDDLVFPPGAARLSNSNNFPAGTIFNSIIISGGNYNLYGTNIVLNAGINATNATVQNHFFIPLTLNSNQTMTTGNSGVNLYVSGDMNLNGKDLTVAGKGVAQVSAVISGAGGLVKSGSGSALLYASNTFSGVVQILQGELRIYHANALSSTNANTTISAGATLSFANSLVVLEPLALAGALINASGLTVTLNGPIILTGTNATIFAPLTINGVISGSGGFTKTGSEALFLNTNNTYTGTTTISDGVLQINGSQPGSPIVLDGNSVTLAGAGRVGTITASGSLLKLINPGYFGPAILSSSNVTLNASSTYFSLELNGTTPGTGYDQLNVTGTVNLASANLVFSLGFTPSVGDAFRILNNDASDAIVGTFNGLAEGAFFTNSGAVFRISYTGGSGNDVVLTRVNPPSQFTSVTTFTNGQAQLQGLGLSNLTYTIQANSNLNTTNWIGIGTAPANGSGAFTFTDTNAPSFPMRFYRALSP